MTRLTLTQRILLVILAVQAALFAALAWASLEGARRDIATETRLAVDTARALVLATAGFAAPPPPRRHRPPRQGGSRPWSPPTCWKPACPW